MPGKVIFTKDTSYEIKRISDLSNGYIRKIYVYGSGCYDIEVLKQSLDGFLFVPMNETFSPKYSQIFFNNTEKDFFVIKCFRFSSVMDKIVAFYQDTIKGYKLVIDVHPFMEKKDIYWSYFLWSFIDRSLLGYPHFYAFSSAKSHNGINPLDPKEICKKIYMTTETTIPIIFKDDIRINVIPLDEISKDLYQDIKAELFDTETRYYLIINKLRKFIESRNPIYKKGLKLYNIGGLYKLYEKGEREVYLSDAKVDTYLEQEFRKYIKNVNTFMGALWSFCGRNS